jgi:hypothetical protein
MLNGFPFQITKSASFPKSKVPVLSKIPSDFAGFLVSQVIALASEITNPALLPAAHALAAS